MFLGRIIGFLLLIFMISRPAFAIDSVSYETDVRPLLIKKCITCHNTNSPKAGVNIDNYKEHARVVQNGQFWLKVLDEIKTRSMPPKTEPPLSEEDYQKLVSGIDNILQKSLEQKNPGHVVIRRLSHAEYTHTIKDLLGIEFDARNAFPSDGSGGGGFDNQGRALFFTPLKLERYYDAAEKIIFDTHCRAVSRKRGSWEPRLIALFRERQAHQRAVEIEFGQRTAPRQYHRRALEVAKQRQQRRLHLQHHLRTQFGDFSHISGEVQRIAQPQLAVQQYRPALQGLAPQP